MSYTKHQHELMDALDGNPGNAYWHDDSTLLDVAPLLKVRTAKSRILSAARKQGIVIEEFLAAVEEVSRTRNGQAPYPQPISGTQTLRTEHDPLRCFVEEILAEGLTILAGKPKKGKSCVALDMSLSISVGRQAFMKFPTLHARVLYVSLEDGPRRIQRRLKGIQANLTTLTHLDFLYTFPRLGAGAFEALAHYAETYQVIIIDTLGRILPTQNTTRQSLSEYQLLTDVLAPIHQLAEDNRMAIVTIDHLRKASVDDDIDGVIGSQAKGGMADHLLFYTRKGREKDGVLQVLGRDLDDEKFVLSMVDGHLEFLGKGEIYELDSEHNKIITILGEEARPMGVRDIMLAMGIHGDTHYERFRKVLQRLYKDDRIGKTQRGLYRLYGEDRAEGVPF
jgi:AAA domain